jgi:putative hydrolase of the HAD superfamily
LVTDERRERQRWHSVVANVFRECPQLSNHLLEHLWQHFAHPDHWLLFDDVAETWSVLAARGYVLGIASNFDSRLRQILKGHACLAFCPHVFVSTELGYSKPDERFFSEIERRLGALPQQLVMVGDDDENDVAAPRRRGWQAIALTRNSHSVSGIRALSELARLFP